MKVEVLAFSIVVVSCILQLGESIIIESATAIGIISAAIGYINRCKYFECCDDEYVPRDTMRLKRDLKNKLYGQQIAQDIIFTSVHSHVYHANPRKPLVLSLHGLPGSGKNYVVTMIANALFKNGEKSSFYHFFNGRSDFPDDSKVILYKLNLGNKIQRELWNCERCLFVFDEVDKMPPGVLDALVPFLDYTSWNYKKSKSIFIFLSNTGSGQIVERMISLWDNGINREATTIRDFEPLISLGAFNEKGGMYKSGTIESKLIDHYVPFLPMEEKQVIQCLQDVFEYWNIHKPSKELIKEALSHVTYGPHPHNLYSTAGCKRLDHKVSSIIFKRQFGD